MQRSDADGTDPDAELRQVVSETVLEGMLEGVRLGDNVASTDGVVENMNGRRHGEVDDTNGVGNKRSRTDG